MPLMISLLLFLPALDAAALETGYASWYGGKFQGRQTANGEIFDTNKLTAAHKTLPFGTEVLVTHLANNRTVRVRINDRGPFVEGRIIDLSRAAAERLGMLTSGVALVKLEVLGGSGAPDPGPHGRIQEPAEGQVIVQVASFSQTAYAAVLKARLEERGLKPVYETLPSGIVRVLLPAVPEAELPSLKALLAELGHPEILVRRGS